MSLVSGLLRMARTRNVGAIDRVLRALPLPVVAWLIYTEALSGVSAWAVGIVSAMLAATAVTGSCSIYYLLGWSTCPARSRDR
jgi:hypothetical protein